MGAITGSSPERVREREGDITRVPVHSIRHARRVFLSAAIDEAGPLDVRRLPLLQRR